MSFLKNIRNIFHPQNKQPKKFHDSFYDQDTDLRWISITKDKFDEFANEFSQMNSWSSNENIQKYISSRTPIDKLFKIMAPSANQDFITGGLYFAYENNDFVGILKTSEPFGNNSHATIEFIVVNPQLQGNGYGTRMIKSASKHLISDISHGIMSSVEYGNTASAKAFEKSGFVNIDSNASNSGRRYKIFHLKPQTLNSDQIVME